MFVCAQLLVMCDSVTPWTVACQTPLSMIFPRQELWSGLPSSPPGYLPKTRDRTHISHPALAAENYLALCHLGSPHI